MPNKFHNNMHKTTGMGKKDKREDSHTAMTEKSIAWPGLPGKTQPKDRSGGVKRCKCHTSSIGL